MKKTNDFIKWVKNNAKNRGILCHFYIHQTDGEDGQKQYYDKMDYAHFNLLSYSHSWVVKGTPNHGINSMRGKRSQVPCLNCFEVDDDFNDAFKKLSKEGNKRFELGILLNKRMLKSSLKIIDVTIGIPSPRPQPNKCHHYDLPRGRLALQPFNHCKVVRIEIPKNKVIEEPIVELKGKVIMGLLVRSKMKMKIIRLLKSKGLGHVKVFSIL